MNHKKLNVAVTGLNAADNPGPEAGIIRALRSHPDFTGNIIGLVYDNLDSGFYKKKFVDYSFVIPYLSEGADALCERIDLIRQQVKIDVIIPTLAAELPLFMAIKENLATMGIGIFIPTAEQFKLRAEQYLTKVGKLTDIHTPKSIVITKAADLFEIRKNLSFPVVVKGPYCGTEMAYTINEAIRAFCSISVNFGGPVIIQNFIDGEKLNVIAVGDDKDRPLNAVVMRRIGQSQKGKNWVGVTISDTKLIEITNRFISRLSWRGPCELKFIKDHNGDYYLIKVNPHFPDWVYLSTGSGINLPYAVACIAAGRTVEKMTSYVSGKLFVHISQDTLTNIQDFQNIAPLTEKIGIRNTQ